VSLFRQVSWLVVLISWQPSSIHSTRPPSISICTCSSTVPPGGVISALFLIAYVARSLMSYPSAAWNITNLLMTRTCSSKFDPKRSSPTSLWSTLVLLPSNSARYKWTSAEGRHVRSHVLWHLRSAQIDSMNVVTVAGSSLPVTTGMRSLGVILNGRLSFDNLVCRACNYTMHGCCVTSVRCCQMTYISNTRLQHCNTHLDCCNSLKYNTSNRNLASFRECTTQCRVLCYKFQDSYRTLLCRGHYAGFQSLSDHNFQIQCHDIKCQENINVIISPQSAKRSVHIIINVTTVIRQPLLEIRRWIELIVAVVLSVLVSPKTKTNFQIFEDAWKFAYLKLF